MGIKAKKICLRILIIVMLVVTVGLVVRAIFNLTTGKKLERTIMRMEAEGKRLAIREFEPECEDHDNAALIWKGVEAMFLFESDERKMLTGAMEDVFYDRPLDRDIRERIYKIKTRNERIFPLLQAASEKSCFKYNSDWDVPPEEMEMPDAVKLISILRLCGIDSVLKAEQGALDGAVDQCLQGIRLSRIFLNEPFLMSYLISIVLLRQQLVCLNKVVSGRPVDTELLTQIFHELDRTPWQEGYIKSFETERVYTFSLGMQWLGGHPMSQGLRDRNWIERMDYWLFRPVYKTVINRNLHFWDNAEKAAPLPYFKTKDTRDWITKEHKEPPWYLRMADTLLPNLTTAMFKQALNEARIQTARIGIASKIFHNKNGQYPEKVSDLVPEFFAHEPLDPFTGKSFVYRRVDPGFIVYSIGSNGKDDGGRGTWNITEIIMEKDDDQAWQEGLK
jgi:hypothetical protein